jgi:hypothetical protein
MDGLERAFARGDAAMVIVSNWLARRRLGDVLWHAFVLWCLYSCGHLVWYVFIR